MTQQINVGDIDDTAMTQQINVGDIDDTAMTQQINVGDIDDTAMTQQINVGDIAALIELEAVCVMLIFSRSFKSFPFIFNRFAVMICSQVLLSNINNL